MKTPPIITIFMAIFVLLSTLSQISETQQLNGGNYIERQLLCALDRAPCDHLGRQIKDALPEIIGRNCVNCNQQQLSNAGRIARYVQTKYPDVWNALIDKYGGGKRR